MTETYLKPYFRLYRYIFHAVFVTIVKPQYNDIESREKSDRGKKAHFAHTEIAYATCGYI